MDPGTAAASLRWRCQTHPQMPGVGAYDVDIASAELPCGASWIGNVLLELGVGLWHPWGADSVGEWRPLGGDRFRYERADEGWTRLLPGLRHGREFRFRAGPVPRLGHHWPCQYPPLPVLLVVRDPRDALYSAWRRERARGAVAGDFAHFVASPFRDWPLSWAGCYTLHTRAWLQQIATHGGRTLRFEDFKQAPLAAAAEVAAMLAIDVDGVQLQTAVAASTHTQVRAAEDRLLARGVAPVALLAGGQREEWRGHFDAAMHAALPSWLWETFAPLGYVPEHPGAATPPPDPALPERLLRAHAPT
ncbi:MAG: hypothetical protein DYH17_01480 [Xanthomonadales bacterium PRO6]|nr:hypothetical protein [Xanthomonadales bacterium]MCE7930035.1 hypothetical protein [Xanthomonadales bacterium PRO6]